MPMCFFCSLLAPWKILLFIPYGIFQVLIPFVFSVYCTEPWMKDNGTDEEWKTRTKITDEDEMKDTYKSHHFKILYDTDNLK